MIVEDIGFDDEESDDFDDEFDDSDKKTKKQKELVRPRGPLEDDDKNGKKRRLKPVTHIITDQDSEDDIGNDDDDENDKEKSTSASKHKNKNKDKKKSKNKKKNKNNKEKSKSKSKSPNSPMNESGNNNIEDKIEPIALQNETSHEMEDNKTEETTDTIDKKIDTPANPTDTGVNENENENGNESELNKQDGITNGEENNENQEAASSANENKDEKDNDSNTITTATATTQEETQNDKNGKTDKNDSEEAIGFDIDPDEPLPEIGQMDEIAPGFASKTQMKEAATAATVLKKELKKNSKTTSSRPVFEKKQTLMKVTQPTLDESSDEFDSSEIEAPLVTVTPVKIVKTPSVDNSTKNKKMKMSSPIGKTEMKNEETPDNNNNNNNNTNDTSDAFASLMRQTSKSKSKSQHKNKKKKSKVKNEENSDDDDFDDSDDDDDDDENDDNKSVSNRKKGLRPRQSIKNISNGTKNHDDSDDDSLDLPVITPKSDSSGKRKQSVGSATSPLDQMLDDMFDFDKDKDKGKDKDKEKKKKKDRKKDKKKKKKDKDKKKDKKDKDKKKKKKKHKKKNKDKDKDKEKEKEKEKSDDDLQGFSSDSDDVVNVD